MLKTIKGYFSNDMAIDLGTANTLIYVKDRNIILNEPSVVAIKESNGKKSVMAVGNEAKVMLGRTPSNIIAIRPLKDGVIADFQVTEKMLQYFIKKVHRSKWFVPSPRVLVCVPCKATEVEKRTIRDSVINAGASEVLLIDEPVAAAIGSGLPVGEAIGSMVVDIGGGTTEIAIIALGGTVYSDSLRVGGDRFDDAIVDYVRKNFHSAIGESTAERIKKEIGCAYLSDEILEMQIRGRNLAEGVPKEYTLTSQEIQEALKPSIDIIIQGIKRALEQSPPELASDIADRGIALTGGGALLRDLDKLIEKETHLKVQIPEDPLTCVARGGGMVLEMQSNNFRYNLLK